MKITNWRRKLTAALVAGGVLAPCTMYAAPLGANLVVNGGMENVDLSTTGNYSGPKILDWVTSGPTLFAYSHNGSSSSGGVVPDYADGADPPGAGNWYFTSNNTNLPNADPLTSITQPGFFYQDIDVSTGPTAGAIAAGSATFALSAYMSSYDTQTDYGVALAEFRSAASVVLGSGTINDSGDSGADNVWNLTSTNGLVPVGTASVRLSLYGFAGAGGADGYIDNVDFTIRGVPEPSSIGLAGLGLAGLGAIRFRRRQS